MRGSIFRCGVFPLKVVSRRLLREFGIRKALKKLVISLIICTFIGENQQVTNKDKAMITKDKVTEYSVL